MFIVRKHTIGPDRHKSRQKWFELQSLLNVVISCAHSFAKLAEPVPNTVMDST